MSLGTDIYYYGTLSPDGGIMNVSLDGTIDVISTVLPANSTVKHQQPIWSAHGLDGSVQHTLTVTLAGGNIIDVDRVDITLPEPTTATSSSSNTQGQTAASSGNSTPSGLKLCVLAEGQHAVR